MHCHLSLCECAYARLHTLGWFTLYDIIKPADVIFTTGDIVGCILDTGSLIHFYLYMDILYYTDFRDWLQGYTNIARLTGMLSVSFVLLFGVFLLKKSFMAEDWYWGLL